MSRAQSIGRGVATSWAALLIAVIVSFFLSPYVVNKLGSAYYGIWALTLQFTGYLNLFDFGMRDAVVRYTSKYCARQQAGRLREVLTTAALMYLPLIVLSLLITLIAAYAVPGPFKIEEQYHAAARWTVLLTGLTVTQGLAFNVFLGVIEGLRRFDLVNGLNVSVTLLRAGLIVAVLGVGYGVVALALVQLLVAIGAGVVGTIIALSLLKRESAGFAISVPRGKRFQALARRVFGYSAFSLLHSLSQKVIFSSDAIVVGIILSVQAVTPYAIAGSLIQYLRTLLATTAKIFIPAVSERHSRGRVGEVRELFVGGSKFNTLIAIPIAAILVILGREFIGLWMGPQYMDDAGAVLAVLALTQLFSAPNYIAVALLYGISRHNIIAWVRLGEAFANVVLSVVLGKWFGLIGVALGTAISHLVVVLVVVPRLVCPLIGLGPAAYVVRTYFWPIAASSPFLGAVWFVSVGITLPNLWYFFVVAGALVLMYAPCAYFFALSVTERRFVRDKCGLQTG